MKIKSVPFTGSISFVDDTFSFLTSVANFEEIVFIVPLFLYPPMNITWTNIILILDSGSLKEKPPGRGNAVQATKSNPEERRLSQQSRSQSLALDDTIDGKEGVF